jgi:hypothetical protein
MRWTKTQPSLPGYYWYRDGMCNHPVILEVTKYDDALFASGDELDFEFEPGSKVSADDDAEWGDHRIQEPE